MSWFYQCASRQDSKALIDSRSDWSSAGCFISLHVGPEPMVELLVDPFGHCSAIKHSNFEDLQHLGFKSWS